VTEVPTPKLNSDWRRHLSQVLCNSSGSCAMFGGICAAYDKQVAGTKEVSEREQQINLIWNDPCGGKRRLGGVKAIQ
jgi:hypothetical protein